MSQFELLPPWANILIFIAAAALVWFAGVRLSSYAEVISDRTGVGKAFIGALMLGGVTALPEAATTVTASVVKNAPLALNNIFGGVAMQVRNPGADGCHNPQ
jgi:cation:H+ antiporter